MVTTYKFLHSNSRVPNFAGTEPMFERMKVQVMRGRVLVCIEAGVLPPRARSSQISGV